MYKHYVLHTSVAYSSFNAHTGTCKKNTKPFFFLLVTSDGKVGELNGQMVNVVKKLLQANCALISFCCNGVRTYCNKENEQRIFHSSNMQFICDVQTCIITNFMVKWPGSFHDQFV